MRVQTVKVYVTPESYEGLVEKGFDLSDGDEQVERQFYAKLATKDIINQLTRTQRKVVILLGEGRKRNEIAAYLMVSIQEVHQIIARIKRRVEERDVDKEHMKNVNNMVWAYYHYRNATAKMIYDCWHTESLLKDYQRPSIITLRKWIKGYKE